ncbi:hypothetical protein OMAG_000338 [Candidatus Omnitrophus magneticus]|uniref:Uncharacterized protein n=1 Tax=Candidatus Omnitrophus magneticus TaxID=1609969 RepID=A0A0F0CUT6_9BACT|nr:hypothetical protein OMAG_000338 [Candidatus Omnitrophus magneticus]
MNGKINITLGLILVRGLFEMYNMSFEFVDVIYIRNFYQESFIIFFVI